MAATDWRFDDLRAELTRTYLRDLPYTIEKDRLVTLSLNDTVRTALKRLSDGDITAAPVFDEWGMFWGFCDYQQLTRIVVRSVSGQTPPFTSEFKVMDTTTLRDLCQGTTGKGFIYGEYSPPLSENSSMFQAVERMAQEGQHRLAVNNFSGRVSGIVCQSTVLDWISYRLDKLGDGSRATVAEMRPYSFVVTINENATALRAFELMDSRNISMNGVVVVDDNNRVTDVISTKDLRGLLPGTPEFNSLWDTVRVFKNKAKDRFPETRNKLPITCRATDTLETIIKKMADNSVHRCVVVNDNNSPIDMVTQTDVLRFIMRSTGRNIWW